MSERDRIYYQNNKERIKVNALRYYEKNKEQILERRSQWHQENKFDKRVIQISKKYDITLEQYLELLEKQNHCCAICTIKFPDDVFHPRKNIDHCHKTGKVRGVLCNKCNMGISLFDDNTVSLTRAINYLKNANTETGIQD